MKIFFLSALGLGAAFGVPFNPKDVKELQDSMNQAKESRLEERNDDGDPDTTEGRHQQGTESDPKSVTR